MGRRSIVMTSALAVAAAGTLLVVANRGGGESEAAAAPTPPPGLTRTQLSRVLLDEGGAATFKPGMDTVVLRITLAPGASVGWHSHPGAGVFLIDKGTVSNYGLDGAPCEAVEIEAGKGYFVSPHPHHPHLARNDGTETAEATVYYFNVPVGQPASVPAERPAECPATLN